jgi:16S rRNA (uracil1498-N3)-methyltransferase
MSHAHRFFIPPESAHEEIIALPAEEAHHAQHVLRVRQGDAVELFDGAGSVVSGVISEVNRQGVRIEAAGRRAATAPQRRLVLVQAAPNRQKTVEGIIQRATELGVAEIRLFRGENSERPPRLREKWRRLAIESCKQCGRAHLPQMNVYPSLQEALSGLEGALLVAALIPPHVAIRDAVQGAAAAALVIGPEGDLSDAELELARSLGAKPISLGQHVLRSEVAATVGCALVAYEMGHFAACAVRP